MDRVGQKAQPLLTERKALVEWRAAKTNRGAVRIVAYGDSLTAGFPSMIPYATALGEALDEAGLAVEISACGMCGLTAEQMLTGIDEPELMDPIGRTGAGLVALARRRNADIALIMAGTNDLANPGTMGDAIARSVQGLHKACHARGVRTVALAIPDAGIRKYKRESSALEREALLRRAHEETERSKRSRRRRANALLAQWARSVPAAPPVRKAGGGGGGDSSSEHVPSLEDYLKALDMEEEEGEEAAPSLEAQLERLGQEDQLPQRPELFVNVGSLLPYGPHTCAAGCWTSDALHFTGEGSRTIGKRLATVLQPLVSKIASTRVLGPSADSDDAAAPSLEAYLEAFRMEDELGNAGEEGAAALEDALPREWEEEAAVRLQRFFRGRRR